MPDITLPGIPVSAPLGALVVQVATPQSVAPGVAGSTGRAPGPALVGTPSLTLSIAAASSTGAAPAPQLTLSTALSVAPGVATSTGAAPNPTVTAAAPGLAVAPAPATSTATAPEPVLVVSVAVSNFETDYVWAFGERGRAVRFRLTSKSPSASTKLHAIEVAHRRRGR